ncbi:MAG: CpsD/CapB family tyrosine-protein kinase [Gammaproteobacteria bacterium]
MEKIKQALQRARDEQTAAPPRAASTAAGGLDGAQISYSSTRVTPIATDVLRRNRILMGDASDPATTAYKILRTQVEQRLVAQQWNAIAVTSPGAGQGKTLTAVNLAVALAREVHRTVLLVDLDLRRPSVHSVFGLAVEKGLVDFLLDDVPLSSILVNPGIERLVLLPAGRAVADSSELLASPKMARLVEELKSRYPSRIIVFDLPPLLSADDALAFSPYVDTTLMVVEDGRTTRDELTRAVEMLGSVHLMGTVLNKSSEIQDTYG